MQVNQPLQSANHLGIQCETVQQWRSRWLAEVPRLTAAEVTQAVTKNC